MAFPARGVHHTGAARPQPRPSPSIGGAASIVRFQCGGRDRSRRCQTGQLANRATRAHHFFHLKWLTATITTILTPPLSPPTRNSTHPQTMSAPGGGGFDPRTLLGVYQQHALLGSSASGVERRAAECTGEKVNHGNTGVCGRQRRASGPRARSMRSIKRFPRVLGAAARATSGLALYVTRMCMEPGCKGGPHLPP